MAPDIVQILAVPVLYCTTPMHAVSALICIYTISKGVVVSSHAQGCACQVLWRGHLPEEEAAEEAGSWKEAYESELFNLV